MVAKAITHFRCFHRDHDPNAPHINAWMADDGSPGYSPRDKDGAWDSPTTGAPSGEEDLARRSASVPPLETTHANEITQCVKDSEQRATEDTGSASAVTMESEEPIASTGERSRGAAYEHERATAGDRDAAQDR